MTEYNKFIIFHKKWPTAEVRGQSGKPFGAVVHRRERRTTNPLVRGSNPLGPTFVLRLLKLFLNVNHFFLDKALPVRHKRHYEQIESSKARSDSRLSGRG